jgi:hypothetical protein
MNTTLEKNEDFTVAIKPFPAGSVKSTMNLSRRFTVMKKKGLRNMVRLLCTIMVLQLAVIACGKIKEKNLQDALAQKGLKMGYSFLDIKKLSESDYRRGYGTPTVLVNGEDLFGAPKPKPILASPS